MISMKKWHLLFTIAGMVFGIGHSAMAEQPLSLVTLDYPPFTYQGDDGQQRGIAVEILKEAFTRMQQPITITNYPFARSVEMVKNGEADAIFTFGKNPERETFVDYPNEVLVMQPTSMFVRKDSPISYNGDLTVLTPYSFGTIRKTSHGKAYYDAVQNHVIDKLYEVADHERLVQMLINKRIDIIIGSRFVIIWTLKQAGYLDLTRELTPEINNNPTYLAFSKKKNMAETMKKFDEALKSMRDDGTYDKILQKELQ